MSEIISIIVPVYNLENYIRRAVESICRQTYQNLEILLVDDGSKDHSLELMHQLAKEDKRIRVLHQENGGVTKARFTGIAAATGEWIGFVDGDDVIEPDMYERLLYNAHTYDADISHCGYQMVFPNRVDYYYNTGCLVEQDNLTGLKDLISGQKIEPGLCNKLFRKNLLHSLLHSDFMDMSIKNLEDLLMNYYLFKQAKKSVFEDFCPYYYMVRKSSASTSSVNIHQMQDPIQVFEIIRRDTDDAVLQHMVDARLLAKQIRNATVVLKKEEKPLLSCRKSALYYIRKNLIAILRGGYGRHQKLMALCVAISPTIYASLHAWYAHIKGTDRKYSVE